MINQRLVGREPLVGVDSSWKVGADSEQKNLDDDDLDDSTPNH